MNASSNFQIEGQYVDVFNKRIFGAKIIVENGVINSVIEDNQINGPYLMPGFVDAHVHIESSMLVPTEFARLAVVHGTVATISDPHEIANVCGIEGVNFMIENSQQSPLKVFFGAPSCVPATYFETAGADLTADLVETLLDRKDIWYLTEMMNYLGVIFEDQEVHAKLNAAKKVGKTIDGHAPGLTGEKLVKYAQAGISTDHESVTFEEAFEKWQNGIKCLIREGSAAKNFEALSKMIATCPNDVMFCSDDKHPDDLIIGHINQLVKRALALGYNLFDVLKIACVNPIEHYKIPVGQLKIGDAADFIVVDNLSDFNVLETYVNGHLVAQNGKTLLENIPSKKINNFQLKESLSKESIAVYAAGTTSTIRVIEAIESQLITNTILEEMNVQNGMIVSDTSKDILKIVVVNRYDLNAKPAVAFIKNFGLKSGAIASTVAHDCHNIIAVGVDDDSIICCINKLIFEQGGVCVSDKNLELSLMPLPIAGLMTDQDGYKVAAHYSAIDQKAKELGSTLKAPFMTLSFMALLVIPSLKLSDKGLFDGNQFSFVDLKID